MSEDQSGREAEHAPAPDLPPYRPDKALIGYIEKGQRPPAEHPAGADEAADADDG